MYELNNKKEAYKYNPLDPRNWTPACQFNFLLSLALIIDYFIGFSLNIPPMGGSYFQIILPSFWTPILPLLVNLMILALSAMLNEDIDDSPFFGAILIKIILFLGFSPFTILGIVAKFILNLGCSILIVTVLVFNILFDMDQPYEHEILMLAGLVLFCIQLILNILFLGWNAAYYLIIAMLGGLGFGIFLIFRKRIFSGALILTLLLILNNYILPYGIDSLGAGSLILLASAILLLINNLPL